MATIEELVIELVSRTENVEQKLEKIDSELKKVEKDSSSAKKGMEELSKASERTATSGEKAGRGARKAGDEIERAGRKAHQSSVLLDKAQRRLTRGWIKALSGYMVGLVAAGTIIGFIKDSISKTLDSASAIGKVSEASGRLREEVHAVGSAFRSLGVDQQAAYKYLEDFNNGKYDKATAQIGIRTKEKGKRRRGEDVLIEMGRKAVEDSGGDKGLAAKRLQAIGLEEQAAKAAVSATKELIAEKQKAGLVTDEQIQKAEELSRKYSAFAGKIEEVKEAFGYALMPVIEGVMKGIESILNVLGDVSRGFEEASGGVGFFQTAMEIIFAPIQLLIGFVQALLEGLGGVSTWAETGGKVVYGFFTLMQSVWNACIMVINALIAALEGLVNAVGMVGWAVSNAIKSIDPSHKVEAYSPVKFGQVKAIGGGGGGAKAPSWGVSAGRGAVRGSWGMPGAGHGGGGGRSGGGRGRRGGGGGGRGGAGAGKQEPTYRSTYQGNITPQQAGLSPVIGKIAEDPAKVAAREAKKAGRKAVGGMASGATQVASAAMQTFNFNNSIVVNAQGNPNAQNIASRTADAVSMVSRRQAGAMA